MAWFVVFSAPSRYPHPTSTLSTRPSATWNRLLTLGASTVPVSHPDCIGLQQQALVGHGFVMHGGAATLTTKCQSRLVRVGLQFFNFNKRNRRSWCQPNTTRSNAVQTNLLTLSLKCRLSSNANGRCHRKGLQNNANRAQPTDRAQTTKLAYWVRSRDWQTCLHNAELEVVQNDFDLICFEFICPLFPDYLFSWIL
uniref:Secreted protein n=1 Tax=Mesocestoides corti TaxID=53468 RepID=A0A5K3G589_MESCO